MEIFYAYHTARINKIIIHVLHGLIGCDGYNEDLHLTEIQIRCDPTHKHHFRMRSAGR